MSLSANPDATQDTVIGCDDTASSFSLLTPERFPVTLALALGVGSHAINRFVTMAVLPDIIRDLGGQDRAFWVFSVFEMTAILAGFMTGAAKVRYGAKAPFLLATMVLAAGSLLSGLSPAFEGFVAGRALQGFGEGVIIALCYALIPDVYPQKVASRVFAMLAGIWALAAALGPISAGLLTEAWSWRAAFLINIPLTLVLAALILTSIPGNPVSVETMDSHPVKRDRKNLIARLLLLVLCIFALTAIGEFRDPLFLTATIAVGIFATLVFLKVDRNACTRLIPQDIFKVRTLIGLGTWIVLLISITAAVRAVFVTTFGQVYWGLSVTEASYVAALLAMSWTILAWISARTTSRQIELAFLVTGPILIALGLGLAGVAIAANSLWLFMTASIVNGAGHGVSNQILMRALMYGARNSERDLVSGMLPSLSSSGAAIGGGLTGLLAVTVGLINPEATGLVTRAAIESSGSVLFYIMAAITLLPAAATFILRHRLLTAEGEA